MRTTISLAGSLALLGLLATGAGAQDKPDFSGKWKLDPAQSQMGGGRGMGGPPGGGPPGGGPPGGGGQRPGGGMGGPGGGMGNQEITVAHSGTTLRIVQTIGGEERVVTHAIGGASSTNTVGMGRMPGQFQSTTTWDGGKLVTMGTQKMTTPNGEMSSTITEVRSLSADGKTLTVETTTVNQMGENTRKMVYVKS